MENAKRTVVRVVTGTKRNKAETLTPKGAEVADKTFSYLSANGRNPLGLKTAPKSFTIIYYAELGKPYVFLKKVLTP